MSNEDIKAELRGINEDIRQTTAEVKQDFGNLKMEMRRAFRIQRWAVVIAIVVAYVASAAILYLWP